MKGGVNAYAHADSTSGSALDGRRVGAALIDLLLLFTVGFLLGAILGGFGPGTQALAAGWTLYYYFALESGGGQTLGKKLMNIRVVAADGSPAGMGKVAIRTVLRVVDGFALYLVGLIVMLVTGERRQRLGDLAAGTIVTSAAAHAADAPADGRAEPAPALPELPELSPELPDFSADLPELPQELALEPGSGDESPDDAPPSE
jgi:uncharacterized RDD family membrane protein YckC